MWGHSFIMLKQLHHARWQVQFFTTTSLMVQLLVLLDFGSLARWVRGSIPPLIIHCTILVAQSSPIPLGLCKLRSLLRPKLRPKLRKPCFSLQFLQKAKRQGRKCAITLLRIQTAQSTKLTSGFDPAINKIGPCTPNALATNYTTNARADSGATKLR